MANGVSLKEFLLNLINGNDKRCDERITSLEKKVDTAIITQDKSTQQAFQSSQKAIDKSEVSQKIYNDGHNDLTKKMESQYANMVPRMEYQQMIDRINIDIKSLRETRSESSGKADFTKNLWMIVGSLVGIAGIAIALIALLTKR